MPEPMQDERPAAYAERLGLWYAPHRTAEHKKQLGQYQTPLAVAYYMAGLFRASSSSLRILDPGAGTGILSCALCEIIASVPSELREIDLVAYEIDPTIARCLGACLAYTQQWLECRNVTLRYRIVVEDVILANADAFMQSPRLLDTNQAREAQFDLVISNPPYTKVPKTDMRARVAAMMVHGQSNLYALFMMLSAYLLKPHGTLLFITPRSYTSGPYFRLFRERFFAVMKPEIIHLFDSRTEPFSRDKILQENVILVAQRLEGWHKRSQEATVAISTSAGTRDISQLSTRKIAMAQVMDYATPEKMLRIPISMSDDAISAIVHSWRYTLHALGMEVSTGPVVAFRAREWLDTSESDPETCAPLLWMNNVQPMQIMWPAPQPRKPQFIRIAKKSHSILLAKKNYVVMRRFSAKEEQRRIIAAPFLGSAVHARYIGFENHLNYLYRSGGHLTDEETYGLAILLNSELLDRYFRISNGNTQVSATELRRIPLPSIEIIRAIGARGLAACWDCTQKDTFRLVDMIVYEVLGSPTAHSACEAPNANNR